jgi:hypothetical protein
MWRSEMVTYIKAEEARRIIGRTRQSQASSLEAVLETMAEKLRNAIDAKGKVPEGKKRKPGKVFVYDGDKKEWMLFVSYGNRLLWGIKDSAGSQEDAELKAKDYLRQLSAGKIEPEYLKQVQGALDAFKKRGQQIATKRKKK